MDQVGAAARYGMMMVSQRQNDAPVAELKQAIEAQNAAGKQRALEAAAKPPAPETSQIASATPSVTAMMRELLGVQALAQNSSR